MLPGPKHGAGQRSLQRRSRENAGFWLPPRRLPLSRRRLFGYLPGSRQDRRRCRPQAPSTARREFVLEGSRCSKTQHRRQLPGQSQTSWLNATATSAASPSTRATRETVSIASSAPSTPRARVPTSPSRPASLRRRSVALKLVACPTGRTSGRGCAWPRAVGCWGPPANESRWQLPDLRASRR